MYARAFSLSYGLGESCGNVFVRRSAQKNRAVAALNSVELITTLLLRLLGLRLRIANRVVSLLTTQLDDKALAG
jgi:hypothetical protein